MNDSTLAQDRAQKRNIFADRLIRDIIVQVSLVAGLFLLVWFFVTNYSASGGTVDFRFWEQVSGVDQPPPGTLPTTSKSTVASVFGFGILNTLIVAVTGIILATILGFIFGVMRLSNNLLLSRFAQVYIEFLRNIPLAVQFLFLNAVLLTTLPGLQTEAPINILGSLLHNDSINMPSLQYGNGDGSGTWLGIIPLSGYVFPTQISCVDDSCRTNWFLVLFYALSFLALVALTFFKLFPTLNGWAEANQVHGKVVDRKRKTILGFVRAAVLSLLLLIFFSVETSFPPLVGWSMLVIFVISLLWAGAVKGAITNWADDKLDATGSRPNINSLSWLILVMIVGISMFAFGGPISIEDYVFNDKGRPNFGYAVPISMIALIGALAIYTSAFIAEIVRAGIQSVNKGQSEAAASLGLRPGRIMNLIIIPQALKVIIPPLNSQFMNLAKNSSLAFILKYPDLIVVLNPIRNKNGKELEAAIMILVCYLIISLTISVAMNYINARVQIVER